MEFYFFLFCGIGLALGLLIKNILIAIGIITAISFCWFFIYGEWAFLSFAELLIGYCIILFTNNKFTDFSFSKFIEKLKIKNKEKEAREEKIKSILLQIVKEQYSALSEYMDAKLKNKDLTNYNNIITTYYTKNGKLIKTPSLADFIIFCTTKARVFFEEEKSDKKILNEMYNIIKKDEELREGIYDNLKLCTYICAWYDSELFRDYGALSSATKKEIKKIIHDVIG